MTFLYRILRRATSDANRVYLGKIHVENGNLIPKGEPFIFVANHPSSLLDPLVCAGSLGVPIYFLGRADLFKKKLVAKFLRATHMWPIYRSIDGKDSLSKNEKVFKECYASLKEGNPILLYGEGFTDEQFVRRVKKIKKGAVRIAMGAELEYDFNLNIKIVPIGINYTNPENLGSDLIIRVAEPIKIKDYKAKYEQNNVKTLLEITDELEKKIQNQIIHVKDSGDLKSFEKLIQLDECSMHYSTSDGVPSLSKRWEKTKWLSEKINGLQNEEKESIFKKVNSFWNDVNVPTAELFIIRGLKSNRINIFSEIIILLIGSPIALLGLVVNLPLFILLEKIPPKLTRRSTFYPGMKVAFGAILTPILLLIECTLILPFVEIPYLLPIFLVGGILSGVVAVKYLVVWKRFLRKIYAKRRLREGDRESLQMKYNELIQIINR